MGQFDDMRGAGRDDADNAREKIWQSAHRHIVHWHERIETVNNSLCARKHEVNRERGNRAAQHVGNGLCTLNLVLAGRPGS